jgi:hypothetical protein
MAKRLRADILALTGFALESVAAVALWLCYLLHHFIAVAVILLVVSGCFFAFGIVAFLYASLALGGSAPSSEVSGSPRSENP